MDENCRNDEAIFLTSANFSTSTVGRRRKKFPSTEKTSNLNLNGRKKFNLKNYASKNQVDNQDQFLLQYPYDRLCYAASVPNSREFELPAEYIRDDEFPDSYSSWRDDEESVKTKKLPSITKDRNGIIEKPVKFCFVCSK
uniref:Uncharacterized protein n=1 Tax=Romanomermis culicivorax TaxID=13658 RepID=A0A915HVN9_ROMCU